MEYFFDHFFSRNAALAVEEALWIDAQDETAEYKVAQGVRVQLRARADQSAPLTGYTLEANSRFMSRRESLDDRGRLWLLVSPLVASPASSLDTVDEGNKAIHEAVVAAGDCGRRGLAVVVLPSEGAQRLTDELRLRIRRKVKRALGDQISSWERAGW